MVADPSNIGERTNLLASKYIVQCIQRQLKLLM